MPPKRAQLLQSIRDAYPEDLAAAVIEQWVTEAIPKLEGGAQAASALRGTVSAASPLTTPAEILKTLEAYQSMCHSVYLGATRIRTVIATRIPEYKEEDNLGVAAQSAFLKLLDGLEGRLLGGGGEEKSSPAPANLFALKAYLAARSAVEEKLLGKPSDESASKGAASGGGSKSPSALLELKQTDIDALLKVELAAAQLASQLRTIVNAYILNWKKLIQPRSSNDRMMS